MLLFDVDYSSILLPIRCVLATGRIELYCSTDTMLSLCSSRVDCNAASNG